MRGVRFAVLVLGGVLGACESGHSSSSSDPVVPPAVPPPPAPQPARPHPLPATITGCELEHSGFMGLGSERRARVTIRNDGAQAGTFTVRVIGLYPGGGEVPHATVALPVPAHGAATGAIDFHAQDGMTSVRCNAESPMVTE